MGKIFDDRYDITKTILGQIIYVDFISEIKTPIMLLYK
jgi:hypothetical protein